MEADNQIKIHRQMMDEAIFKDAVYDKWHAWCDLVLNAYEGDRAFVTRGVVLSAPVGSTYTTYSQLTRRWGWTQGKVQRFLMTLKEAGKITIQVDKVICITIKTEKEEKEAVAKPKEQKAAAPAVKKKKVAKPKIVSLVTLCRDVFEKKYAELYDSEYYWNAKDAASMKQLTNKIHFARQSRGLPNEDADIAEALNMLLNTINDDWILKNFSVANINSKYNEIVAQARLNQNVNGKSGKVQRQADAINVISELAREEQSANKVW